MRTALTSRFCRDLDCLTNEQRSALSNVVAALSDALGKPHHHAGLGLRKIHASGIWEGRVGLGLRVLFAVKSDALTLIRVGTHDDVRRYLKSL